MNVKELIKSLQIVQEKFGDIEVHTEGCDCWGNVSGVGVFEHSSIFYNKKENEVLLTRDYIGDTRLNDKKEFVFLIESEENKESRLRK